MQYWFAFNGKSSKQVGWLESPAPIIRPEEAVTHVTIPGRAGDLTVTEGENIFKPYIQQVKLKIKGEENVRQAYKWLRGAGLVTFSTQPTLVQEARIINSIQFERVFKDLYEGDVSFYCQPFKHKQYEATVTLTSGDTVFNGGDAEEHPIYTLNGNGNMTVTVGGKVLAITEVINGCIIDTDTAMVTNLAGTESLNAHVVGEMPVLTEGNNTITLTGVTSATISRRERFL